MTRIFLNLYPSDITPEVKKYFEKVGIHVICEDIVPTIKLAFLYYDENDPSLRINVVDGMYSASRVFIYYKDVMVITIRIDLRYGQNRIAIDKEEINRLLHNSRFSQISRNGSTP